MVKLKNKVIIITGGKGLIGKAFVETCVNEGANVVIADLPECDLTQEGDVKNIVEDTIKHLGKIDVLVNCAYPKNNNQHIKSYLLITKEVIKVMKKQNYGNIINIASIYGSTIPYFELYEDTNMNVPIEYAIAKAGIIQMTKYLSQQLKGYNIQVNSISPGGVFDNQNSKFVERYKQKCLYHRMVNVEDLNITLLFLLTNNYITGQNIIIDGGFT